MIKKIIVIIILLLFTLTCNREAGSVPPQAVKGVLDLRNVPHLFSEKGKGHSKEDLLSIPLDGEWEFYPGEFCDPDPILRGEACLSSAGKINYISVPGSWNDYTHNGQPMGGKGYGTYRLRVLLPAVAPEDGIGLKLLSISTAYKLFSNGKLIAEVGEIAKTESEIVPAFEPQVVEIPIEGQDLELLFQVANFDYDRGGLWDTIKLGNRKDLENEKNNKLFLDFFLAGSLLIMGLYHLGLFALRRKDKAALYFGLFSILMLARTFLTGEQYLYPFLPWGLGLRMEYLGFYIGTPIFLLYLNSFFPDDLPSWLNRGVLGLSSLLSLVVILLPTYYFTQTLQLMQLLGLVAICITLYTIGRAVYRKREGAIPFLSSSIFFSLIVLQDLLHSLQMIHTGFYSPYAFFIFVFSQVFFLSTRFSQSFTQAEKLSIDLEQKSNRLEETTLELSKLTENLEKKVEERTKDLEETKQEIEDIHNFTYLVNSLPDLNSIFIQISQYFYDRFGITGSWLFLPDEKKEYLYAYKAYSYRKIPKDQYDFLMNKKIPIKEVEGGMIYKTFQRKKSFYLGKIPKFAYTIDKEFAETLHVKSVLHVPLVRKEECVGIFVFSNLDKEMKLTRHQIHLISNLCAGIASSIDTNHLLQQVEKARAQSDLDRVNAEIERGISIIAKMEVEKAKQKTEDLNRLLKQVNEHSDLSKIMEIVLEYLKDKYSLPYYSLFLTDPNTNRLSFANSFYPEYVTEDERFQLSKVSFDIHIQNKESIHSRALESKNPIFIPDVEKETKTESGKYLLSTLKHKSLVSIPLFLQNTPIATLDLFSTKPIFLNADELIELSFLGEQLAGVINGAILLKKVQEEKEKVTLAKKEAERAKVEVEFLNEFNKKLNSNLSIDWIMDEVFNYVAERFQFDTLFLLLSESGYLKMKDARFPEFLEDRKEEIFNLNIPLKEEGGLHYIVYSRKKSYFLKDVQRFKEKVEGADMRFVKVLDFNSAIYLPLIIQDKCIGILDFVSIDKKIYLSKEERVGLELIAENISSTIFNSILLETTNNQRKQTEELNKLIKSLNEELDLKAIMKKVHAYVKENFGIQHYGLYVPNEKKTHISLIDMNLSDFLTKEDEEEIKNLQIPIHSVKGAHALTFLKRRPFYIPRMRKIGVTKEEKFVIEKYGMTSFLMIPLILNNEPIGILDLSNNKEPMELSKEDITKLSILGEQLAGIIHGSNLLKQVQEEKEKTELVRQEIETLNEFTKLINSTSDMSFIFNEIYSYLNRTFGINNLWLLLVDKNSNELYSDISTAIFHKEVSDSDFFHNFRQPLNENLGTIFQTYKKGVPLYVDDISKGDIKTKTLVNQFNGETYSSTKMDIKILAKGKLKSILQIPLLLQGEVIGIFCLGISNQTLELSLEDIEKLMRFSNQIAGVIHNANLLKQTEEANRVANIEKEKALEAHEESEKAKAQVEFFNEFSKLINSSNILDVIFSHAVENLSNKIEANLFFLQLVDKTKNELFMRCSSGTNAELLKKYNKLRVKLSPELGSVYLTYSRKRTLYLRNTKKIPAEKKSEMDRMIETDFQFTSVFQVPLLVNEEVIGIMHIDKMGGMKKLDRDEIRFAESLCEQLALAVNNSFLLEATEASKKETEELNKLMRKVNSVSSLIDIMSFVMLYLEKKFNFKEFYLLLNENTEKSLIPFSFTSTRHTEKIRRYFLESQIEHSGLHGVLLEILETKKPQFLLKENISKEDLIASAWIEKGDFDYLLLLPIVIYDELIGILFLHTPKEIMFPSEEVRLKMERFIDLIAGSVFNAKLLKKVEEAKEEAEKERSKSEKLLLNILPKDVASELKEKGYAEPVLFEQVSVMFTDFKGFTTIAETLTPQELIKDLDACFVQFDKISERFNLEKLKTIGDSYMCAGGIPRRNTTHAIDCCLAALEIQDFMNLMKRLKEERGFPYWELRLGIHTGPLIAGVIGEKKFAYDVWGDTVNTASRMESSGTPGRINISYSTYEMIKELFDCEYRGEVSAKNKGIVKMYYLNRIKPEYAKDPEGKMPNGKFWEIYG